MLFKRGLWAIVNDSRMENVSLPKYIDLSLGKSDIETVVLRVFPKESFKIILSSWGRSYYKQV